MSRIVFMLEERSMKTFIHEFIPRFFPDLEFLCLAHEGKQDLEKSIPRKLRSWTQPGDRFVIVRDNDGGDCVETKRRLVNLCQSAGQPGTLVRIACQELEAWYLGDPNALAAAFEDDRLKHIHRKSKFRDCDDVAQPSKELKKLAPAFQKISGARLMGTHMNKTGNGSHSFNVFLNGVQRICTELNSSSHSNHRKSDESQ